MAPVRIECFHRVLPASQREDEWPYFCRGSALTCEQFDRYLEALGVKYEFIDESSVLRPLASASARPACWVTFDDGYQDNLHHVAPILARHGVRPSLYVTTRAVSGDWWPAVDRFYAMLRGASPIDRTVTWGEISERWDLTNTEGRTKVVTGRIKSAFLSCGADEGMRLLNEVATQIGADNWPSASRFLDPHELGQLSSLGWYIGPHGHEHRFLPELGARATEREVLQSHETLERIDLPNRSRWFAYANGRHDETSRKAVERLLSPRGYDGALTIDRESANTDHDVWQTPRWITAVTDAVGTADP